MGKKGKNEKVNQKDEDTAKSSKVERIILLITRLLIGFIVLGVGIYVVLSPDISFHYVDRAVLFSIISILPAILFGAEATSHFKFKLPGLIFTTTGAAAISFGLLFSLHFISKPGFQIVQYSIRDEYQSDLVLQSELISIKPISGPKKVGDVNLFLQDNNQTIVLIFTGEVRECELKIRKKFTSKEVYKGIVKYTSNSKLGLELKYENGEYRIVEIQ